MKYQRGKELKMNKKSLMIVVVVALMALAVFVLGVGLAYERGHNGGYNDGWYDGTAYAESWGWQGCVEENNLYERY